MPTADTSAGQNTAAVNSSVLANSNVAATNAATSSSISGTSGGTNKSVTYNVTTPQSVIPAAPSGPVELSSFTRQLYFDAYVINKSLTLEAGQILTIPADSVVTLEASLISITNKGSIINNGTLIINSSDTFSSERLVNDINSTFTNNGTLTFYTPDTIICNSLVNNQKCKFTNTGTINLTNTITKNYILTTIVNSGIINVNRSAIYNYSNLFTNSGRINVNRGSYLTNMGATTFTNKKDIRIEHIAHLDLIGDQNASLKFVNEESGLIINQGLFNNIVRCSITNNGTIITRPAITIDSQYPNTLPAGPSGGQLVSVINNGKIKELVNGGFTRPGGSFVNNGIVEITGEYTINTNISYKNGIDGIIHVYNDGKFDFNYISSSPVLFLNQGVINIANDNSFCGEGSFDANGNQQIFDNYSTQEIQYGGPCPERSIVLLPEIATFSQSNTFDTDNYFVENDPLVPITTEHTWILNKNVTILANERLILTDEKYDPNISYLLIANSKTIINYGQIDVLKVGRLQLNNCIFNNKLSGTVKVTQFDLSTEINDSNNSKQFLNEGLLDIIPLPFSFGDNTVIRSDPIDFGRLKLSHNYDGVPYDTSPVASNTGIIKVRDNSCIIFRVKFVNSGSITFLGGAFSPLAISPLMGFTNTSTGVIVIGGLYGTFNVYPFNFVNNGMLYMTGGASLTSTEFDNTGGTVNISTGYDNCSSAGSIFGNEFTTGTQGTACPDLGACEVILSNFTTYDGDNNIYTLTEDIFITGCQELYIPIGATVIVPSGLRIENYNLLTVFVIATLIIEEGGSFYNNGTFANSGTFTCNGDFTNDTDGLYRASGYTTLAGSNNTNNGSIINRGMMTISTQSFSNNGRFLTRGIYELFNDQGEQQYASATTECFDSFSNGSNGKIIVARNSFFNIKSCIFENNGQIENDGEFSLLDTENNSVPSSLLNQSKITNTYIFTINNGSTVNNNVTFDNYHTINNISNSIFNNNSFAIFKNIGSLARFNNNTNSTVNNNQQATFNIYANSIFLNNYDSNPANIATYKNNTIVFNASNLFNISGSFTNYSKINNNNAITIQSGGTIVNNETINSNSIINYGTVTNNRTLTSSGTITNYSLITNNNTFTNNGTVKNSNLITNNSTITNNELIENYANKRINNNGNIVNSKTIINSGEIINDDAGITNNSSSSFNNEITGYVNNINGSTITSTSSSVFVNTGRINNSSSIITNSNTRFFNRGTINNSSLFEHNGLSFSNTSTITNTSSGTISITKDFINLFTINNDGIIKCFKGISEPVILFDLTNGICNNGTTGIIYVYNGAAIKYTRQTFTNNGVLNISMKTICYTAGVNLSVPTTFNGNGTLGISPAGADFNDCPGIVVPPIREYYISYSNGYQTTDSRGVTYTYESPTSTVYMWVSPGAIIQRNNQRITIPQFRIINYTIFENSTDFRLYSTNNPLPLIVNNLFDVRSKRFSVENEIIINKDGLLINNATIFKARKITVFGIFKINTSNSSEEGALYTTLDIKPGGIVVYADGRIEINNN